MNPIPPVITDFLRQNHVLSLATCANDTPWAASCFYVFDETTQRLLIMSAQKTQHAQQMQQNPHVAGTISAQAESFGDIAGIQFSALAECLTEKTARKQALALYSQKHPIAKLAKFANTEIWALNLTHLKHTANKVVFAHKTEWTRE